MARLNSVSDQSASPDVRAVYDRVKNRFGKLLEPVTIAAIHPDIFKAYIAYEASFRSASRVNGAFKELALLKVAAIIGCPCCIDPGSALAKKAGITEKQLKSLALYSKSPEFSLVERVVLDLANAMTPTPAKVSEDLFLKLQQFFDPMQIGEITAAIVWENYRSRFNHALGIESHGFSEGRYCVPPERPAAEESQPPREVEVISGGELSSHE